MQLDVDDDVMTIEEVNGYGDQSSKPGRDCLHLYLPIDGRYASNYSLSSYGQILNLIGLFIPNIAVSLREGKPVKIR